MIKKGEKYYTADRFDSEHNEIVEAFEQIKQRDIQIDKMQRLNYDNWQKAERKIGRLEAEITRLSNQNLFNPDIHSMKTLHFSKNDWSEIRKSAIVWDKLDKKDRPTKKEQVATINKHYKLRKKFTIHYLTMMLEDKDNLLIQACS